MSEPAPPLIVTPVKRPPLTGQGRFICGTCDRPYPTAKALVTHIDQVRAAEHAERDGSS